MNSLPDLATGARPTGTSTEAAAAENIQQMFDTIAPTYDRANHLLSVGIDRYWWTRAARTLRRILARPEAVVLDLCCGTGDMTLALYRYRPKPDRSVPQRLTPEHSGAACGTAEEAAGEVGVPSGTRRKHVPGAKALVDSESMMPGLKSRPISEASFSAAYKAVPLSDAGIGAGGAKAVPLSDAGFGAGGTASGEAAPILALDFSHNMLALAIPKFAGKNIVTVEADALHLPLPDSSVDLVTSAFGFRNLANYAEGLAELHRVLRPGGQIAILECNQPSGLVGTLYSLYFRRVLPTLGGLISGTHGAYAYLPDSVARFPRPPAMKQLIAEAGFVDAAWTSYTLGTAGLYRASKP